MVPRDEASRLEKALRHESLKVRQRALARLAALAPEAREELTTTAARHCRPRVLGVLFEHAAGGGALEAATLDTHVVRRLALTLGEPSRWRRNAARVALIHGNIRLAPGRSLFARWAVDPRRDVRRAVAEICSDSAWGGGLRTSDIDLVERLMADPLLREVGVGEACSLVRRLLALLRPALDWPDVVTPPRTIPRGRLRSTVARYIGLALDGLPALAADLGQAIDDSAATASSSTPALSSIAKAAASALPRLWSALGAPSQSDSYQAFLGLRSLRQVILVPDKQLATLLSHVMPHVRANAVRCLPFAQTEPRSGWDRFERALDDPSDEVRAAALETLRHSFREVPQSVTSRVLALASMTTQSALRMNAVHSAAHLPAHREAAVRTLIAGMRARDGDVRLAAASALECLASHIPAALPVLVRAATSDPLPNVRYRALRGLKSMGPAAAPARQPLERLSRDRDALVRRIAAEALAALGPQSPLKAARLARARRARG
jgi:HEAT repeat protein